MQEATEPIRQARNTGPLGSGWRVVRRGECLLSIAHQQGFLWDTLWNLPDNAKLRDTRPDPGQLLVGDRIMIPERRARTEPAGTDAHHRFLKRGVPAKLRLVVEYEDVPVSNAAYILTLGGLIREGTTDSAGLLEVPIPPDVSEGTLDINGMRYELQLGALDPSSEDIGIQHRLWNLGFYHGALDGKIGPVTRDAIAAFQARAGLPVTGELDETTHDRLLHRHDELHEQLPDQTGPDSAAAPEQSRNE
jgi:N-acetylmuramoyl-L-alanine amidase